MVTNLASFFDISAKERINVAFRSTTADKTMLFSGPPEFSLMAQSDHVLTPLVFTTGFSVQNNRTPGREFPVLSSSDTFVEPSPGGTIGLQLGAYSIISGAPDTDGTAVEVDPSDQEATTPRFNLLKRLYNDIIQYKNGILVDFFVGKAADDNGFKAIAANKEDLFTGFAKSEFYNMEFGILRITLTKGNEKVLVNYYEHCRPMRGFSEQAQAGGASNFQTSAQISATEEVPLDWSAVSTYFSADGGAEQNSFFQAYLKYMKGANGTTNPAV